jgi:hypothetical protein
MGEKKKSPRMIKLEERARQAGLGTAEFKRAGRGYELTGIVPTASKDRRVVVSRYKGLVVAEIDQEIEKAVAQFFRHFPEARQALIPPGNISLSELVEQLNPICLRELDKPGEKAIGVSYGISLVIDALNMVRFGKAATITEAWEQIEARRAARQAAQ